MSTIAIADIQRTAALAVRVRLRLTRRGRIVFTTLAALPPHRRRLLRPQRRPGVRR
ncbi:hypothetical protein QP157_17800 [Sphingomonas sp. LR61]|uniref:hypothetical protein n=1 Tax=Sphingomonas sp. LR61 TaxID=3050234 RepID=UPI002FE36EC1